MSISWPLDNVRVTGEWANSPEFYAQFGQAGHNGIDLAADTGTPVYACDAGIVVAEGWGQHDSWMGSIAGIFVRLQHWWGFSAVAHLSRTFVNVGQQVARGERIALSGATGVGTGPHVHFETFPLSPHFGNGFAGRINPRQFGLVARGSSGQPSKPTAKDPIVKIVENTSSRAKRQSIKPGVETRISYNDNNDVTLAFGPLNVYGLFPSIRLKGKPGARAFVRIYREKIVNGKVTSRRTLTGQRAEFNELGLIAVSLSTAAKLGKDWRIRATVVTEKDSGAAEVTDFRWSIVHAA